MPKSTAADATAYLRTAAAFRENRRRFRRGGCVDSLVPKPKTANCSARRERSIALGRDALRRNPCLEPAGSSSMSRQIAR